MATDATTQLIQRILSQLPPGGAAAQTASSNFLSQADSVVGNAASYAQLLALGAAAAGGTEGVSVALALAVAFFLAALTSAAASGSTQTQQLNQLINAILDTAQASYWQDKLMGLQNSWDSPTGGLGTDLDNLANEGTAGVDVKNDVSHFHDHASAFVNNLIPSKSLDAQVYWERPVIGGQFQAQNVVYGGVILDQIEKWGIEGWYGAAPQAQPGPPLQGQSMATDPRTMLPFLLLGIESYLSIEALVNVIDPSQPTFSTFLTQFQGDLRDYASFIYSQYQLAVNGIVKSDLPSGQDMLSYLWFMADVVNGLSLPPAGLPVGASPFITQPSVPTFARRGWAWNGVYGVVDTYPQYGAYLPPVPVPFAGPSYILDVIDTSSFYVTEELWQRWTVPWVEDKLILGRMARWKAIYLNNGYGKVWSILQKLQSLSNQPLLATVTLTQDGTKATGNWSARELCSMLTVGEWFLLPNGNFWAGGQINTSYSLFALVQCLGIIAGGNWSGPPNNYTGTFAPPAYLSRPIGFRDRLAAAAV
jgi:hypothetical protein